MLSQSFLYGPRFARSGKTSGNIFPVRLSPALGKQEVNNATDNVFNITTAYYHRRHRRHRRHHHHHHHHHRRRNQNFVLTCGIGWDHYLHRRSSPL